MANNPDPLLARVRADFQDLMSLPEAEFRKRAKKALAKSKLSKTEKWILLQAFKSARRKTLLNN